MYCFIEFSFYSSAFIQIVLTTTTPNISLSRLNRARRRKKKICLAKQRRGPPPPAPPHTNDLIFFLASFLSDRGEGTSCACIFYEINMRYEYYSPARAGGGGGVISNKNRPGETNSMRFSRLYLYMYISIWGWKYYVRNNSFTWPE